MADQGEGRGVVDPVGKGGYELEFEDTFDGDILDQGRWLPYYLPQWSSREAAAARYRLGGGDLRLLIEADQPAWCPEFDGGTKVSSLQTGVFSGPVGSTVGQSRFRPELVVREAQEPLRLYTPRYGLFELRAKAVDDPRCMVALWMIGYEDEPERSAEICVCEIFGRNVTAGTMGVGMGLHPFGDPAIRDEFSVETLALDPGEVPRLRGRVDAGARGVLRRPPAGQDRRAVAGVSDAADARHLRVPRGLPGRRAGHRAATSVPQAVHRGLRPRLPAEPLTSCP